MHNNCSKEANNIISNYNAIKYKNKRFINIAHYELIFENNYVF